MPRKQFAGAPDSDYSGPPASTLLPNLQATKLVEILFFIQFQFKLISATRALHHSQRRQYQAGRLSTKGSERVRIQDRGLRVW